MLLRLSCAAACLASVHNWYSLQIEELLRTLATEQQSFNDKYAAATQQIKKLKETWEGAGHKLHVLPQKRLADAVVDSGVRT